MTDTQRAVWAHRDIDASGFRDTEKTPLVWVVWSTFELSPGIHELTWEETSGFFFVCGKQYNKETEKICL